MLLVFFLLLDVGLERGKKLMCYDFDFAARVNSLRLQKDVSAREMSIDLGMNPGYISGIESGKALPSMDNFYNLCEYLDVTPDEFFDTGSFAPAMLRGVIDKLRFLSPTQLKAIDALLDEFLAR